MDSKMIIIEFILSELANGQREILQDDESLLEAGIIDSMGIMKLLSFIEDKFSIKILDEELIPENFDTIAAITGLMEKKGIIEDLTG